MQSYWHNRRPGSGCGAFTAVAAGYPRADPAGAAGAAGCVVPAGAAGLGGRRCGAVLPGRPASAHHVHGHRDPRSRRDPGRAWTGGSQVLHRLRLARVHLLGDRPGCGLRRGRRFLCAQSAQARGGCPHPALRHRRDLRGHARRGPVAGTGGQTRYPSALVVHGLNPLLAIGLALFALAWAERSWALLVFAAANLAAVLANFYDIDGLLRNHGWAVALPWTFVPRLWTAGAALLLLAGAAFAIAGRLRA